MSSFIIKTSKVLTSNLKSIHNIKPLLFHKPPCRPYCDNLNKHEVDFNYVNKMKMEPNTILIDVREPDELKEHGQIPNSINIPLNIVKEVLGEFDEEKFKKLFNRPKPNKDTEIIFFCMIGKRSGMAQQDAISLGFKNAKNYKGSFIDWKNNTS